MVLIFCGIVFSGCISSNDANYHDDSNNDNYYTPPNKVEPNFEKPVKLVLEETPISEDSKIKYLQVVNTKYYDSWDDIDYDNDDVLPLIGLLTLSDEDMTNIESFSLIEYDNDVLSAVVNVENPDLMINNFKNAVDEDYDEDYSVYDVKLSGNGDEYTGYKFVFDDGTVLYIVKKVGYNIVIAILGDNEEAVKDLTRGVGNGLPSYVKQEIYVLPNDMPSKYHLEFVRYEVLGEDYVREKGYSEWAKMMVGKKYCDAWYSDDDGNYLAIGYIDLENVDYAKKEYDETYSKEDAYNAEKVNVNGYDGWYVIDNGDEINFRAGYYILFVDGVPKAGKDTLLNIAERLQV
jgi:hypothetical protein